MAVIAAAFAMSKALDNGLAMTPPMGWTSWSQLGLDINQTKIESIFDAMANCFLFFGAVSDKVYLLLLLVLLECRSDSVKSSRSAGTF